MDDWMDISGVKPVATFSAPITDLYVEGDQLIVVTEDTIASLPLEQL